MLAADLTITRYRQSKLDFIQPYSHISITAVIQKPEIREQRDPYEPELTHLFKYHILKPFSAGSWCMIVLFFLLVILMHQILALLQQCIKNDIFFFYFKGLGVLGGPEPL